MNITSCQKYFLEPKEPVVQMQMKRRTFRVHEQSLFGKRALWALSLNSI